MFTFLNWIEAICILGARYYMKLFFPDVIELKFCRYRKFDSDSITLTLIVLYFVQQDGIFSVNRDRLAVSAAHTFLHHETLRSSDTLLMFILIYSLSFRSAWED